MFDQNPTPDSTQADSFNAAEYAAECAAIHSAAGLSGEMLARAVRVDVAEAVDRRRAEADARQRAEESRAAEVQAEAARLLAAERAEQARRASMTLGERLLEDHRKAVEAAGGKQPHERDDPLRPNGYAVFGSGAPSTQAVMGGLLNPKR